MIFLLSPFAGFADKTKPNIVYIMLDEWGYFEWSGAGHHIHKTPNIDRLAAEGVRFTRMLAGAPVCAPTRSTLMTGQHTGHTTVRANGGTEPLRDEDFTIAEMLKVAGYATGGFGKWGLGDRGTTGAAEQQGFDQFFGYYHQVHAHTYYPNYLVHNGDKIPLPGNSGHPFKGETFAQSLIHEKAQEFIREHAGKEPFFAYLPYTIPHAYYGIPEDDPSYLKFKGNDWKAPQHHKGKVAPPDEAQRYAAFVDMADRQIGDILKLLKNLGVDDNTIVFLCGDNGANTKVFLDKKHPNGFFKPNTNPASGEVFRGGKGNLNEGGLRVPFMVRWPGMIAPGTTSDHLGYFPDVMPTLANISGSSLPPNIDGISFLPALLGKGEQEEHDFLYWEFGKKIAIRKDHWKLIANKDRSNPELFDLSKDITESINVAKAYPDILKELISLAKDASSPDLTGRVIDPTLGFKGHAAR
ncbi:MAG: arylsulfatase [Verrucomicrobiaceae bacterium]